MLQFIIDLVAVLFHFDALYILMGVLNSRSYFNQKKISMRARPINSGFVRVTKVSVTHLEIISMI